jgi:hypothetical protein
VCRWPPVLQEESNAEQCWPTAVVGAPHRRGTAIAGPAACPRAEPHQPLGSVGCGVDISLLRLGRGAPTLSAGSPQSAHQTSASRNLSATASERCSRFRRMMWRRRLSTLDFVGMDPPARYLRYGRCAGRPRPLRRSAIVPGRCWQTREFCVRAPIQVERPALGNTRWAGWMRRPSYRLLASQAAHDHNGNGNRAREDLFGDRFESAA